MIFVRKSQYDILRTVLWFDLQNPVGLVAM
jgi:hypothetical protein